MIPKKKNNDSKRSQNVMNSNKKNDSDDSDDSEDSEDIEDNDNKKVHIFKNHNIKKKRDNNSD